MRTFAYEGTYLVMYVMSLYISTICRTHYNIQYSFIYQKYKIHKKDLFYYARFTILCM